MNVLPVLKVDNNPRVSSFQDSSHCLLAMILDPSFKNKMPGCLLEDPDIACEHILNLDPQIHSYVSYKKQKGDVGSETERATLICSELELTWYTDL